MVTIALEEERVREGTTYGYEIILRNIKAFRAEIKSKRIFMKIDNVTDLFDVALAEETIKNSGLYLSKSDSNNELKELLTMELNHSKEVLISLNEKIENMEEKLKTFK